MASCLTAESCPDFCNTTASWLILLFLRSIFTILIIQGADRIKRYFHLLDLIRQSITLCLVLRGLTSSWYARVRESRSNDIEGLEIRLSFQVLNKLQGVKSPSERPKGKGDSKLDPEPEACGKATKENDVHINLVEDTYDSDPEDLYRSVPNGKGQLTVAGEANDAPSPTKELPKTDHVGKGVVAKQKQPKSTGKLSWAFTRFCRHTKRLIIEMNILP